MRHYLEPVDKVLSEVSSSETGLSSSEAASRLAKVGPNKLKEGKKTPLLVRLINQLKDPMILILLAAAAVSTVLDIINKEVPYDTFIILFVVIVNAVLGVVQESKAEAAIEALQQMAASMSRVLRDGQVAQVKSVDLVPGDVIVLDAGDAIPADCRLLEAVSMKVEEAALTGESVPVTKQVEPITPKGDDVPLGDRKNMVYMGSSVAYGRGKAVVVATGMDTEMGKIADVIAKAEESLTPLQIKLAGLSKILSFLVIGICAFIFGFNVVKTLVSGDALTLDVTLASFMTAVSLAVAAIPEGLVAVVTIVLSIGVTNMSKKSAIIRKLTAVETLGCAQIICSDKTGTLTQNRMTVVETYGGDEKRIAESFALCTDASLKPGQTASVGDPTQTAVVDFALKVGLPKYELEEKHPRVGEIPFDSMRKLMTTVHVYDDHFVQHTTGAPDVVIGKCTSVIRDGKIVPMTDELRAELAAANKALADKALRVLASGIRVYKEAPASYEPKDIECDLCFLGLVGMIDPVRPEVKAAIDDCRSAGITPVMITGDHKDTAVAIAKELGIVKDASQAITGAELSQMCDEEFAVRVKEIFVYARVQPEHKTRIVNAWRDAGYITAMTGDGVNDAPSIKSADIGVGMGITGTDVTKNVADMVLADDNFATIVVAVGEGRRIYDNIRKAIQFLLGSNLSEVLSVFIASVLGFTILKPTHLLFINLVTDCFPALALGVEKPEKNIMSRHPRKKTDGIFSEGLGVDVLYQGALVTALTLIAYFIGAGVNEATGMTMAFLTMSMCEIFHAFNMRSQRNSIFTLGHFNPLLAASAVGSLLLTFLIIEVPALATVFDFAELDPVHYLISLGLAVSIIPIVEVVKFVQRKIKK